MIKIELSDEKREKIEKIFLEDLVDGTSGGTSLPKLRSERAISLIFRSAKAPIVPSSRKKASRNRVWILLPKVRTKRLSA